MAEPRIVKATCPQCGAGLHIAPGAAVVTCDYCKLSSFIQRPDAPPATHPPDGQRYGTIHLDPEAGRAVLGVYLAVVGVVLFLGVGAAIVGAVSSAVLPASPAAAAARDPSGNTPGSATCEKAVACCKVALGGTMNEASLQQTCNAHRLMPDSTCTQEIDTLRKAAKALHRTCN